MSLFHERLYRCGVSVFEKSASAAQHGFEFEYQMSVYSEFQGRNRFKTGEPWKMFTDFSIILHNEI